MKRELTWTPHDYQAEAEVHEKCPEHGTLLNLKTRKCVLFDHYPALQSQETGGTMLEAVAPLEVDLETGEITGQLMLGFRVPQVTVQKKAETEMTVVKFNEVYWEFGEGDKLSAAMKDGRLVVKMVKAWEVDRGE